MIATVSYGFVKTDQTQTTPTRPVRFGDVLGNAGPCRRRVDGS